MAQTHPSDKESTSKARREPRSVQERREHQAQEKSKRSSMRIWHTLFVVFSLASLIAIVISATKTGCVEGDKWVALSKTLDGPREKKEIALRGNIYASTGEPLRVTVAYYKIDLDLKAEGLKKLYEQCGERKVLDTLADVVLRHFPDIKEKKSHNQLVNEWTQKIQKTRNTKVHPIVDPIGRLITYYEYNAFFTDSLVMYRYDRKGNKKRSPYYRGFKSQNRYVRACPYNHLADATIGSINKETGVGNSGLEAYYDDVLSGADGRSQVAYASRKGTRIITTAPIHGYDLYTTIDPELQRVATNALREVLEASSALYGTAILMESSTGRIVAISNLKRLAEDPVYKERDNSACIDFVEPGSTIKPVSMMIALDRGIVTPEQTVDVGNGVWEYGKRFVRDHNANKGGYGVITYEEVMKYSSNVGIAKMIVGGFHDSPNDFRKAFLDLGFDELCCQEIPGAQKSGIKPVDTWDATTLAWLSFGYVSRHPPINILAFYNAIANGGKMLNPYLVDRIVDKSGRVIHSAQPKVLRDSICSDRTIEQLRHMLRGVVVDGTGKAVNSPLVSISGKTGTAQTLNPKTRTYEHCGHYVSFCGYFPSDNPRYSVISTVMLPPGVPYSAGHQPGAVVRAIAEAVASRGTARSVTEIPPKQDKLKGVHITSGRLGAISKFAAQEKADLEVGKGIQHDTPVAVEEASEGKWRVRAYSNVPKNVMPNLIGFSVSEALYQLQIRGVKVHLVGQGHVIAQSHAYGTELKKGEVIVLTLGYRSASQPKPATPEVKEETPQKR